ncbi:mesoderm posterior protein 2-like [Phasianus colchicus]|uniref:BHLH domain-containing protein n=1 Tax=Phasianus colchicus TaxID=9054 RepID=A0A669PYG6_PHACC|nr:mesoderm posterior protein 2-like [Phasianus colchicus]
MAGSPLLPHSLQTPTAATLTPPGELCRPSSGAGLRRCGGPAGRRGSGVAGGPRQSASEREKLRMRRLAQAMHRLRHYLPPALAPAGQSLTKIETLRLATRYIAHLSALLGLSEEVLLLRRGAAPRRCPLCHRGLGCCQPPHPRLWPPAPQDASPPDSEGWGSPPELHGALDVGTGTWASLSNGPVLETRPELHGVPDVGMGLWSSPFYSPTVGTPPELHGTPGFMSQPSPSLLCSIRAATPMEPPQRCAAATGTRTAPSYCMKPAAPSLHPGMKAKAMGPSGLHTCSSQIGSPLDLDMFISSDVHGTPVLPSCSPARCWEWWS